MQGEEMIRFYVLVVIIGALLGLGRVLNGKEDNVQKNNEHRPEG